MAMTMQAIRELTIRAKTEGVVQAAAALEGVAAANREVAAAAAAAGAATDTSARKQQSAAGALKTLESRLDGVARANRQAEAQTRTLTRAFEQELLNATQLAEKLKLVEVNRVVAVSQAQQRLQVQAANAQDILGIGDAPEKLGLASYQMGNLRSQLIDIGTMASMGASPLMILSSQAGQIYEALAGANGGVTGALGDLANRMSFLVSPTTAVVGGLALAILAVRSFGDTTEANMQKAEKAAESYERVLRSIRTSQGNLSDAAGRVFDRNMIDSPNVIRLELQKSIQDQVTARKALVENMLTSTAPKASWIPNPFDNVRELGRMASGNTSQADLGRMVAEVERGERSVQSLREELLKISVSPDLPSDLKTLVDKLLEGSVAAREAESRVKALTGALQEQARVAARERIVSATDAFSGLLPETKTIREQIAQAYALRAGAIDGLEDSNPRVREGLQVANTRDLAKALGEVERQESVIRDGRALDIREVNARTTAERATIASARERASLSGQAMDPGEREAQIAHAAAMVYAEDARRMSDAARDRSRSYQDMITSLQTEAATLDMTRGAAMAYQRQQELIVQLYRDAADQGRMVDPAEVEEIKRVTAAAGALTDQISRLNAVREQEEELRGLVSRAGTIGGTDDAARRASARYDEERRLREENEDVGSPYGAARIRNALKMSDFGDEIRRSADAWDEWRSAGESAIDSVVDGLASGTADIGDVLKGIASDFTKTFLQLAVSNPLKNALLGTSYGTIDDLFTKTAAPTLADAGVKAFGTVAMTAAVVNLNGSPLGLGSLASNAGGGSGGASGAITKFLNPGNSNSAVAAAGSGALNFVGNYKSGVNSQLTSILQEAAKVSGLKVEAFSGLRPGDSRFHGKGLATDIRLFDQAGKAIPNYQNAGGFRAYEQFAQVARQVQMEKFPELADKFRWGGYFGGQKGKYGAMDTMHFDVGGGKVGMAGGSWDRGLNATQRSRFPGAESIGMAEKSFKRIEDSAAKMASSTDSTVSSFASNAKSLTDGLSGTFSGLDQEMLRIANDFTPAFGSALQSVLDAFASSLGNKGGFSGGWLSALAGSITGGMTGAPGGGDAWAGLRAVTRASGGIINGPGTGTSDSIPMWASDGEFVVNAKATAQNRGVLEAINSGRMIHRAIGGLVAPALPSNVVPFPTMAPAASGAPSVTVINQTGTEASAEVKQRPDGSLEIMLRRKVAEEVGTKGRPANKVLARGGLQTPLVRR